MQEIKKYLETRIGTYAFFFEDLDSGYSYGYNENVQMTAAGCMKLPIAVSVIKYVEDGKTSFLDKISISESDKVKGTGILYELNNREYTVFELLVAMLIQSDNTAANKLINLIGMDRINKDIQLQGLKNTKLNRMTSENEVSSDEVENITSALDLSKIWKSLENASFLNRENSTMLIDILTKQQLKNKISLYIPDNLKFEISSKSGDKNGVENDTALIHLPKGTFSFTMLSMGIPNSVYGTVTLAKCGKRIWDDIMNNWK